MLRSMLYRNFFALSSRVQVHAFALPLAFSLLRDWSVLRRLRNCKCANRGGDENVAGLIERHIDVKKKRKKEDRRRWF